MADLLPDCEKKRGLALCYHVLVSMKNTSLSNSQAPAPGNQKLLLSMNNSTRSRRGNVLQDLITKWPSIVSNPWQKMSTKSHGQAKHDLNDQQDQNSFK